MTNVSSLMANTETAARSEDSKPQWDYGSLEEAFPKVDAGVQPFGDRVLVQIRSAMKQTKGGIFVPEEARETEKWNTQVAKVIALGPVAFRNRDTLEEWPEGAWAQPGEFIRVPLYGGDRWEVPVPGDRWEPALFVMFRDMDLGGRITGDPLSIVAYLG